MIKATPLLKIASILVLTLLGCSKDSKMETELSSSAAFKSEVSTFAKKHNAVLGWDTLGFEYSIDYEKVFSDSSRLVLVEGSLITDIFKEHGRYFIFGNTGSFPSFYYTLECAEPLAREVAKNRYNFIYFAIKLTSLKKIELVTNSKVEGEYRSGDEDGYETIQEMKVFIEPSDDFLIKGKVIDILILED